MKQQHKKLQAAIDAEVENAYTEGFKYPEQSTPRAYYAGRDFVFRRVAGDWYPSRSWQALADLCEERLSSHARCPIEKPHAFCMPWVFTHPCFYKVYIRAEMKAYRELLGMLRDYCGIERAA